MRLAFATPRRGSRRALATTLLLTVAVNASGAQSSPADSALLRGDLSRAESLYYAATRARPRDPVAREALARYVAARGASRVAAVLFEEARLFGGDATRIGRELAPLYEELGDWRAVLTLPASPLDAGERRRAAWLSEHRSSTRVDSTPTAIAGMPQGDTLGRVAVHLGGRSAMAILVARDEGITIGSRLASGIHRFGPDSSHAVADSITVGNVRLFNVPLEIGGPPATVTIGLKAISSLLPTLDYGTGRIAFNRSSAILSALRLPILRRDGRIWVLEQGWIDLADFAALRAKLKSAITVDLPAGVLRVQP